MADELNESAEFGKKHKNEEEPILVAQRFLNIYRQMHIFNAERRQQFDEMLLDMPSDIRILLSTLPGGSLLIEHIEEVEKAKGLTPISTSTATKTSHTKRTEKEEVKPSKQNSSGTVVIDASFANELSSSLSLALQQTERRYKEDIKALTETLTQSIVESQSAIGNMIKDVLLAAQQNMKTDNGKPQVIVVPANFANTQNMATQEVQNLEIQNESKIASEPVTEEKPVIVQEFITEPEPIIEEEVAIEPEAVSEENPVIEPEPEVKSQILSADESMFQDESVMIDEKSPIESISEFVEEAPLIEKPQKKKKKKNKKNKNIDVSENLLQPLQESVVVPAVVVDDEQTNDPLDLENETPLSDFKLNDENDVAFLPQQNDDNFNADDLNLDDLTIEDIDTPSTENSSSIYENELDRIRLALEDDSVDQEKSDLDAHQPQDFESALVMQKAEDIAQEEQIETAPILPISEEINQNQEPEAPQAPQEFISLDSIEDAPVSLDDIDVTPHVVDDATSDFTPPEYDFTHQENKVTVMEDDTSSTASDQNDQWQYATQNDQSDNNEEWEWEYVDETESGAQSENDEWEWEYVEDDGSDENDWEWEYVEEGTEDGK